VPEFILAMRRRGHAEEVIRNVVYDNPLSFFRQSLRWQEPAAATETNGVASRERVAVRS
jgi:hypothetical protein